MYKVINLQPVDLTDRDYRRSVLIFALLVLTVIIAKAMLLSRLPINQDEFHYLSIVHVYERGEPIGTFMTAHVHFFGWLDTFSNEVTQVIAARIVMYFLFLGTCFYLFRMARHFFSTYCALFSVLCYMSFLFTLVNGASFRYDTPSTFFFMFALYHFIVREKSLLSNFLAGAAMAVSLLFTIKAVIYLPVFAGWFLSRLLRDGQGGSLKCAASFLGTLVLCFLTLYTLHAATVPHSVANNSTNFVRMALSTFVTFKEVFPARRLIIQMLIIDPLIWFLLLGGLVVHLVDLCRHRHKRKEPKAFLLILAIPLLSLLVYRNAYPYFFVFILPTATLFCGYALERLALMLRRSGQVVIPLVSGILSVLILLGITPYFISFLVRGGKITVTQHDILTQIHRMFPNPIAYIDGCSMVASFPKVGFFMSSAGMEGYLERREPIMQGVLNKEKPLFLLANVPQLDLHCDEPPKSDTCSALSEADWKILRSYFIHHWGPVWVVGKQFGLEPESGLKKFDIIARGSYTVETDTKVLIDGTPYQQGDIVQLEEGTHTIEAKGVTATISLRWGHHLYRPDSEPESTIFLGPFL